MVFFDFDLKKNIFEGFKTALEKKEVENALKARLGRWVDLMAKRGPTKVFFLNRSLQTSGFKDEFFIENSNLPESG